MKASISHKIFFVLAVVFAVCVAVQVFLAGLAIFVDPARWESHTAFIHIFEIVPVLLLIFSFTGKMPRSLRWLSFLSVLLIVVMYATANMSANLPAAGALHPVAALAIFWIAVMLCVRAWRLAYKTETGAAGN